MAAAFDDYVNTLKGAIDDMEATLAEGATVSIDQAIRHVHELLRACATGPNKVMFIGNGGSAGIAGHMAIDFTKNGGIRSMTFNDASSLTCLANDLGYENVFAKQVEMQGVAGDVLIAISSSGESKNILRAVDEAIAKNCCVITLSGFSPTNTLRKFGGVNFYVKSSVYGFVETAHQVILHAILDVAMGWTKASAHTQPMQRLA